MNFDIFSTNLHINEILNEIHILQNREIVLSIYITETILKILLESNNYSKYFNFKHAIITSDENIKALKDKIVISSNFFALNEIRNKEDLEIELEKKLNLLNKQLFNSAYFDELTTLANRNSFFKKLDEVISISTRIKKKFSLMFLDLDGFKFINDYYGHDAGDIVLKSVAHRLKTELREYDFLARLGGDEFVIIVEDYKEEQNIEKIAKKIISSIEKKIPINEDTNVTISVSIGIAIFPKDGKTKEEILKFSDVSMYEVKKSGKGSFLFFNDELKVKFQFQKEIEKDLDGALKRGEFFLLYQPKIYTKLNAVVGVEALIRWKHPTKGIIPNFKWIPIMENSINLYEISLFVLEEATKTISKFNKKHNSNIFVSVNADIKDILSNDYIYALKTLSKEKRELLTIELLERDAIEHFDAMVLRVDKFKELGIKLSFDDFGTGSTSLSYLSQIAPDELKVDRSFVSNIDKSKNKYIVQAIMYMAKGFNIKVIAEGVETKEELDILTDMGCLYVQGFYFSKPITIDEVAKLKLYTHS